MHQPSAQITCMMMPSKSKRQLKVITVNSRNTSHRPRLTRKRCCAPRSAPVLRAHSQALVPARNMKVGAQKWVIQRVRNNAAEALDRSAGS